jgi:hypothetical protein
VEGASNGAHSCVRDVAEAIRRAVEGGSSLKNINVGSTDNNVRIKTLAFRSATRARHRGHHGPLRSRPA